MLTPADTAYSIAAIRAAEAELPGPQRAARRRPNETGRGPFRADQLPSGAPYELSNGHPIYCAPMGRDFAGPKRLGFAVLDRDPAVKRAGGRAGAPPGCAYRVRGRGTRLGASGSGAVSKYIGARVKGGSTGAGSAGRGIAPDTILRATAAPSAR